MKLKEQPKMMVKGDLILNIGIPGQWVRQFPNEVAFFQRDIQMRVMAFSELMRKKSGLSPTPKDIVDKMKGDKNGRKN